MCYEPSPQKEVIISPVKVKENVKIMLIKSNINTTLKQI